jgi:hypothetical protein
MLTTLDHLPEPRPSFIELNDDAFIRNPFWNEDRRDFSGIDKMLAMTPSERLEWHEAWRQFIRQCLRDGWTPEDLSAAVWGDTPANEVR